MTQVRFGRCLALLFLLAAICMSQFASAAEVTIEPTERGAVVKIDGEVFAEYLKKSGHQPAVWPIIGPTGKPLTRSYPAGPLLPGEMDDHICVFTCFGYAIGIFHIPNNHVECVFIEFGFQPFQIAWSASAREVVEDGDLLSAFQQTMDVVRTDKPGAAGDKKVFGHKMFYLIMFTARATLQG